MSARAIRIFGVVLVLASLGFVAERLARNLDTFATQSARVDWALLPVFVVAFTLSQLLISLAFHWLLNWQGDFKIKTSTTHVLCGRAQITKYIPGNVFQYVARHLAFRKRGVSDGALVMATGYETLSFVMAAGLLSLVGLPAYARESSVVSPTLAVFIGVAAALGLTLMTRHGPSLLAWLGRAPPKGSRLGARRAATVVLLYTSFIAVSGVLAAIVMAQVDTRFGFRLVVVPAYALAWLCGYIVPGASGGLGIREATLLVLLGDTPAALFTALWMRVVTTLGELLWFVASSLIRVDEGASVNAAGRPDQRT